jgi:integrase
MSVQRRTRGGRRRFEVRWREEGRQRSRTFDRRDDAQAFDAERRRRRQLGAHAPHEPSREPLREWLETWWTREAHGWARSTRLMRAGVIDKWIVPWLGGVPLRELGEDRVQEWRGEIRAADCPPSQSNLALGILSSALSAARRARKIPANPCQGIRHLKLDVRRPRALTPLEVERIRAELARPIDAALVSVLAYGGLRPEEALPLRWGDVGRTIVVSRTFTHGELRERTKTGRIRAVEVVDPLAADLDAIRPKVEDPAALVFPSLTGVMMHLTNWRERVFKPAAARAGVKAAPYDLRHSFVSLLIHEGRSVPYVAAMAGHSPQVCLERYAHVFADAQLGTGEPMVGAIEAARAKLGVRPPCDVRMLRASA